MAFLELIHLASWVDNGRKHVAIHSTMILYKQLRIKKGMFKNKNQENNLFVFGVKKKIPIEDIEGSVYCVLSA